jgi:transposase-like protein
MPKKGHSEVQILRALRQAESGTKVSEICREYGIRDATFYIWKKKYSGLGGVDPVWWSVFGEKRQGEKRCRKPMQRTRRSTGGG